MPGEGAALRLYPNLTPDAARKALRSIGLACAPHEIRVELRDERWAVHLPDERMAWFPVSEHGARHLATERQVLDLLAECCSFRAPRLLAVAPEGFEIRRMVPGRWDPWGLFERCKSDEGLTRSIGQSLGGFLAEQHASFSEDDVAGWLPRGAAWPLAGDWIREHLARVVNDRGLIDTMTDIVARYEAVPLAAQDYALIHGDIGLHNLALDLQTDAVSGIFDYDSAAWADRHHDFRYLLFDARREDMLEAALAVYEPALGRALDRSRIALYNAASAVSFLAFRADTPPEKKSCGRTLAEDIAWVRMALSRLG